MAKTWKPAKGPSIGEWIKKLWQLWAMKESPTLKIEGNAADTAPWMNLEDRILGEISQTGEDRR